MSHDKFTNTPAVMIELKEMHGGQVSGYQKMNTQVVCTNYGLVAYSLHNKIFIERLFQSNFANTE
jgi:hypothetical protein